MPEQHHHREDRPELDDDEEHLLEGFACVELQKFIHEQHVPRAAHRQPFRDPFHDTEENDFQYLDNIRHMAVCPSFLARRGLRAAQYHLYSMRLCRL